MANPNVEKDRPRALFSCTERSLDDDEEMPRFHLRLQDCVEGMAQMPAAAIDLVVTSPPYNLDIKYGNYSDRQNRVAYLEWCRQWTAEVHRLLQPGGSFFLNVGGAPSNPLLPHQLVMQLSELFVLQNTIHWIKSISIDNLDARMEMFAAGYTTAKLLAPRIFDRVRPLPGNLVRPLDRFQERAEKKPGPHGQLL